MIEIRVQRIGPGIHIEVPRLSDQANGRSTGVTLTRAEAVDLHGKLVTALWNMEPRTGEDADG